MIKKLYFISKWYSNINGSHCMGYEIMGSSKAIATAYLKCLQRKNDSKYISYNMDWIWSTDPISYITTNSSLIRSELSEATL